jgi:hypothetical protein
MESALITSKRESRMEARMSDLPTAVGPKMTARGRGVSGLRVPIPNLLGENLLEGGGNDLPPVRLQLVVAGKVDLNAALHGRAGHFIDVALKAFEEIQWKYHRRSIYLFRGP